MAERTIKTVREQKRPIFVEAATYRYRGHSVADPDQYRTKEEVEMWRKRDPIAHLANVLGSEGTLSKEDMERIADECARQIEEAVDFAEASNVLPLEAIHEDVYA